MIDSIDRLYVVCAMRAALSSDGNDRVDEILRQRYEQITAELNERYAGMSGDEFRELLERIDET